MAILKSSPESASPARDRSVQPSSARRSSGLLLGAGSFTQGGIHNRRQLLQHAPASGPHHRFQSVSQFKRSRILSTIQPHGPVSLRPPGQDPSHPPLRATTARLSSLAPSDSFPPKQPAPVPTPSFLPHHDHLSLLSAINLTIWSAHLRRSKWKPPCTGAKPKRACRRLES